MDYGLLGLLFVAAVIAAAVYFARPSKVLPLDELLSRLASIHADAQLTAAQKLQLSEIAYRGFSAYVVSLTGGVHEVHPNGSVVIKTVSRELPLVGAELAHFSQELLASFEKGHALALRVRLPPWERYSSVVGLPAGFREARLYYAGRWHGVKNTYRVRDPSEPKTGEFAKTAATNRTGTHAALPRIHKTGEFTAFPKTGQKTVEVKALPPTDDHKRDS
jgi:hypothetical protein